MRHLVKAATLVAGMMVFSGIGFAQCKIVVVNMQNAVVESNEGKDKATKFDAKVADWQKKIETIQNDIDTAQNKLKTQSSLASQSVIADLNKTIQDKTRESQRTKEDAEKDVTEYRDQLLGPVMMVADEVMNALANEKGYSIVFDISAENSSIVYSAKECDVTNEIKTRMNAKTGAATTSAAPASGARGATPPAAAGAAGRGAAPAAPATTAPAAGARGTGTTTPAPAGARGTTPATPAPRQ